MFLGKKRKIAFTERTTKLFYNCFFQPIIENFLIKCYNYKTIHMWVRLECFPVNFSIYKTFECIWWSILKRTSKSLINIFRDYINTFFLKDIWEMFTSSLSLFLFFDMVTSVFYLPLHPLLSKQKTRLEFFIFADEVSVLGHRKNMSPL